MPDKRNEIADLLRRLANLIERHPEEELSAMFGHVSVRRRPLRRKGSKESSATSSQLQLVAMRLQTLTSREAGESLLNNELPTKTGLESLARHLGLPVQRDDTLARLRTKVVEHTIGSRLRSSAIQGL